MSEDEIVKELRSYLPIEAKEAEEFLHLASICSAGIPRIFFKILLYDSMLHSEIISDLILLLSSRDTESLHKECICYIQAHIDSITEHIRKEEAALKKVEMQIRNTGSPLIEALFRHIYQDEENHIALLKELIKEAKT